MDHAFKVGRIFGIDIKLHYSWFFVILLVGWALSTGFFPEEFPQLSGNELWFVGIASAVMLFVSVLLHELSHSFVAKKNRLKVEDITLFFFGGIAEIHEKNLNPVTEFKMAIMGPVFSAFLAGLFYLINISSPHIYLTAITYYLWRINLMLAIFNMIPGFPLDGGRAYRALLWYKMKDLRKATYYAASSGKFFALVLMILGGINILYGAYAGLWLVFLGGFLHFLAKSSYQQIIVKDILSKVSIKEFVNKRFRYVSPELSLDRLVNMFYKYEQNYLPVKKGAKIIGFVSSEDLAKVPQHMWAVGKVKAIMHPEVISVSDKISAYEALDQMMKKNTPMLSVMKGKKLIGIVSRNALFNFIRLRFELGSK